MRYLVTDFLFLFFTCLFASDFVGFLIDFAVFFFCGGGRGLPCLAACCKLKIMGGKHRLWTSDIFLNFYSIRDRLGIKVNFFWNFKKSRIIFLESIVICNLRTDRIDSYLSQPYALRFLTYILKKSKKKLTAFFLASTCFFFLPVKFRCLSFLPTNFGKNFMPAECIWPIDWRTWKNPNLIEIIFFRQFFANSHYP